MNLGFLVVEVAHRDHHSFKISKALRTVTMDMRSSYVVPPKIVESGRVTRSFRGLAQIVRNSRKVRVTP